MKIFPGKKPQPISEHQARKLVSHGMRFEVSVQLLLIGPALPDQFLLDVNPDGQGIRVIAYGSLLTTYSQADRVGIDKLIQARLNDLRAKLGVAHTNTAED